MYVQDVYLQILGSGNVKKLEMNERCRNLCRKSTFTRNVMWCVHVWLRPILSLELGKGCILLRRCHGLNSGKEHWWHFIGEVGSGCWCGWRCSFFVIDFKEVLKKIASTISEIGSPSGPILKIRKSNRGVENLRQESMKWFNGNRIYTPAPSRG